ncbi:nitrous oxide reductase accessory protein NosL [Halopiger goleimassiliensis]|uniref:nitrous oxide reductase accessory protein NosL n=1 Tax=Halopiger goleimassiliensis TaxID=1293048 RepID=UPI000677A830|nr:nitrous oxide reductase accessory protein NosL [Halopiger goleimassiliensis]
MTTLEDGRMDRRRLLATVGAGAAVGVAGCLGGDGNGNGDPEQESTDDDGPFNTAALVDHPGDDPIEFTDEHNCPLCNMGPARYSDWRCQLAHEDGRGATFDTPGCLFAYFAVHPVESPIIGAWVTDYNTGDLVDGTEAHYVIVTDESGADPDEPMGFNPRPFADREDAVSYLEEWEPEELTEDDILELADVTYDTAAIYRGGRMPDE